MWGSDKDINMIKKQLNLLTTYTTMKIKSNIFIKIINEMIVRSNFHKLFTKVTKCPHLYTVDSRVKMSLNFLNHVKSELLEVNSFRIYSFRKSFFIPFLPHMYVMSFHINVQVTYTCYVSLMALQF